MCLIIELNAVISQLEGTFLNLFHLIIPFVNNKQVLKTECSCQPNGQKELPALSQRSAPANDFQPGLEGLLPPQGRGFGFPIKPSGAQLGLQHLC